MATGIRDSGDFCWVNIMTPKPAEAMDFFGKVFDWSFFEMPGIGHGMKVGGRNIGGIFDLEGPSTPPGTWPGVGVMVKVDSADATSEQVISLGGTARPAFDIGDQGRMAVCFDPNGGAFDVWEPKAMPGTDADSTLHGSPSWSETLTTDVPRATAFYSELFGWTADVLPGPGAGYTVFKHGGREIAGMMAVPEPKIPPHWGTYFTVTDADETARLAEDLGATTFVPPMDIPAVGRFCGLLSPQGVRFYAIRYLSGPRS